MELVQIQIIGFEVFQGGMKVFPEVLDGGGCRLGGDDHLFAPVGKRRTDLFLAVSVKTRRVVKVDAVVVGFMQQIHSFLLANPLDGQGAEAVLVDLQVGLP